MEGISYALNFTVRLLKNNTLTFGNYSFSLWQMILAFAVLELIVWFIRNVFSPND
jgi:hypothetical protein